MNVLVYAGPEALQSSLSRTVTALKTVLRSNYTVQTISPPSLASHPWALGCALFVLPSCSKHELASASIAHAIGSYVANGGALLALSAGLRQAPTSPSDTTVAFRCRSSGNYIYLTPFAQQDAAKVASTALHLANGVLVDKVLGWQPTLGTPITPEIAVLQPLATLSDEVGQSNLLAGAITRTAGGPISVWSLPLEHTASDLPDLPPTDTTAIKANQQQLLRNTLSELGLTVPPAVNDDVPTRPGRLGLVCAPDKGGIVAQITGALLLTNGPSSPEGLLRVLEDEHDTFHFLDAPAGLVNPMADEPWNPEARDPREIVVFRDGTLPDASETPLFDLRAYFAALAAARGQRTAEPWGMGEALLYSVAVTSTQTLLDRNPKFLGSLPAPFLALASFQLAGRGRGANAWLSPAGCLMFSLHLRVRLSQLPAARLVFVQYLFALAVAEACRSPSVLGKAGDAVRVKWPNDMYVTQGEERRKIGGILVNTSFRQGEVDIIIGSGLNVHTAPPLTSLAVLLPTAEQRSALKIETVAAEILATFERMWAEFLDERGSFAPFNDLYLERWLHSDQQVTVTTVNPAQKVRIVGITLDHGLLRTVPERVEGGQVNFIDLQPDGNSFDLMAGLIKTKGS